MTTQDHASPHILARLMQAAMEALARDEAAKDFLRRNGIGDESIWSRYRLGACAPSLIADSGLPPEQLQAAGLMAPNHTSPLTHGGGILLPTFAPDAPDAPVGLVKISYSQSRRFFVTKAAGMGIPLDIAQSDKVLVCDNPLQGLRLACGGARGVLLLLSEHLETLDGAMVWLAEREVVAVSPKRLDALLARLKPHVPRLSGVALCNDLRHAAESALRAVGADPAFFAKQPPSPTSAAVRHAASAAASAPSSASVSAPDSVPGPVRSPKSTGSTATLPRDLVAFAQERLREGEGQEALRALGVTDGEMAGALSLGFLPKNYQKALSKAQVRKLSGKMLAGAVLLPALGEQGQVVDLLALFPSTQSVKQANFEDKPKGLLCAKVPNAYPELVLVDSFRVLAHFWGLGLRHLVLMRSTEDLRNNLPRLAACGVKKVFVVFWSQQRARKAQRLLARARIETVKAPSLHKIENLTWLWAERVLGFKRPPEEKPLPPEPLKLIHHDRRALRATFQAQNGVVYETEAAPDCGSKLEVKTEFEGNVHLDRFLVSSAPQRKRYAQSAAMRTKIPIEQIEADLIHLLDAVRKLQEEALSPGRKAAPKTEVPEGERLEALAYLKQENLLDAVAADLEALGWVGEESLKRLLWLIALSRKLPDPNHGALRSGSGSGKTLAIDTICAATPPEDVLWLSSLSHAALFHQGEGLRHKLLVLSESDLLEREVAVQLRVLLSDGMLRKAGTQRDPASGLVVSEFQEAKGPVAFLTATTRELDREVLDRCFDLTLDESEEQTKRILEAQRKASLNPGIQTGREKILSRLRNVQRLIEPLGVKLPFAERIEFPAFGLKHRREHQRFLRLIQASALFHQHQREREGRFVLAAQADFEIALGLAAHHVAAGSGELSRNARDVLEVVRREKLESFCLNDLKKRQPFWTRHKLYSGLEELARVEIVTSAKGRGKVRIYRLQADSDLGKANVVALRPEGEVVGLSDPLDNNFAPVVATG